MKIYIGFSRLNIRQLKPLFDVDFDSSDDGASYIQREFGASRIAPGSYEIYDRDFYEKEGEPYSYDKEFLKRLFPFMVDGLNLWNEDFSDINTIFYLRNEARWSKMQNDIVTITDVLEINKFDFE